MIISAPFPTSDSYEGPYAFNATTFAKMLLPQAIEKGVVTRVVTGIVQVKDGDVSLLQSVRSSE